MAGVVTDVEAWDDGLLRGVVGTDDVIAEDDASGGTQGHSATLSRKKDGKEESRPYEGGTRTYAADRVMALPAPRWGDRIWPGCAGRWPLPGHVKGGGLECLTWIFVRFDVETLPRFPSSTSTVARCSFDATRGGEGGLDAAVGWVP